MSSIKRVDMKLGYTCCNNCRFCVVANKRFLGDFTTEQIKKNLIDAKKSGLVDVVFTGGEPTIRKDIFELVSYAKQLGFRTIQIQTNGRMLYYKNFVEKLIDAGTNEFSPALHGHTAELHDFLTRSPGSFDQTVQGIKNLKEMDQYVLTNTVITIPNSKFLTKIAELLINLKVDQFQFAFIHADGNALKYFDQIVPFKSKIKPHVHKALDFAKEHGYEPPNIMVEAYPFCFMENYEKYCSEFYIPPSEIREPTGFTPDFENVRRTQAKIKGPKCSECKHFVICEGPWREYPQRRGWSEFQPVK